MFGAILIFDVGELLISKKRLVGFANVIVDVPFDIDEASERVQHCCKALAGTVV